MIVNFHIYEIVYIHNIPKNQIVDQHKHNKILFIPEKNDTKNVEENVVRFSFGQSTYLYYRIGEDISNQV